MPTKSRCRLAWPPPLVAALWLVSILAPTCHAATSVSATRPTELLDWPTFGICVGCVAGVVWAWIIVVWAWVRLDDDVWELEAAEEDERRLQEAESARQREQQQQPQQESNSQDTRDPTTTTLHEGQLSDQGTATTTQAETTTRGVENEPFAPAHQTNADQQSSAAAPSAAPQQQGSTSSSTAPPAAQDSSPSSQPPLVARTPSSRPADHDTTVVPARTASQNDVSATQAEPAPPRDELRESTMTTTTGVSSLNASTTETRPRSESIRRRPLTRPRSRSEVTHDSLSRHNSQMTINSDTTPQPQQQEQPAPQQVPPQERGPRQDAAGRQTPNGQAEDGGEAPRSPAKPQRVVTIVTDTREIAVGTEDVFEGLAARGTNRDLIDAQQWIESKRRAVANVDPSPFVEDRPRPVPLLQSHPATGAAEATPRSSTARRDAAQPHTDRGTSRSISMPTPRMAAVADPVAPARRQLPVERSIDAASNNGFQYQDTPDAVAHRSVHTDANSAAPALARQRPLSAGNRSPSHQGGRRASLPLPITNSPDDGEALPPLFEAGDVLLRTYRFPLFEVDLGGSIGVIAPGEACVVDLVEVLYDQSGRYSFSYHFVGGDRAVEQRTVELHMTRVSRDGAKHFEFDDPGAAVRASAAQTPRY